MRPPMVGPIRDRLRALHGTGGESLWVPSMAAPIADPMRETQGAGALRPRVICGDPVQEVWDLETRSPGMRACLR